MDLSLACDKVGGTRFDGSWSSRRSGFVHLSIVAVWSADFKNARLHSCVVVLSMSNSTVFVTWQFYPYIIPSHLSEKKPLAIVFVHIPTLYNHTVCFFVFVFVFVSSFTHFSLCDFFRIPLFVVNWRKIAESMVIQIPVPVIFSLPFTGFVVFRRLCLE